MIKKLLISLIAVISLGIADASAQSANRTGFYLDFSAGSNIGDIYRCDHYDNNEYASGGMEVGLGLGCRVKMSHHWAWDFRMNFEENLFDTNFFQLQFLPIGLRYTGNDTSNGKSFFWAFNTGFSFGFDHSCWYFPVEMQLGINLTRHLSLSIVGSIRPLLLGWKHIPSCSSDEYEHPRTNGFIGARIGYRF